MRKFIASLLVLLLVGALVAGCGSSTPKKIVVGLDDNFPPMGFRDDKNNIVGFDIDMAKEASKRMGVAVEFKPIDWNSKEAELSSKRVDVLWNGLTITEQRKQNIAFSNQIYTPTASRSPLKRERRASASSIPSGSERTMVEKNICNVTTVPSSSGPIIPKI